MIDFLKICWQEYKKRKIEAKIIAESKNLRYYLIEVNRTLDNYGWESETLLIVDYSIYGKKFKEAIKPCYTSRVQKPRNYNILQEPTKEEAELIAQNSPYKWNFYYVIFPEEIGDGRFIDKPNKIVVSRVYKKDSSL